VRIFHFSLIFIILGFSSINAQEQPPAKVVVAEITREIVTENRSFIGLLGFDRTSRVSSDFSGLVEKVLVKEGDKINKGELLIQLDTEILDQEIVLRKNRIEQAQLSIELARKNLTRLETLLSKMGTSEKNFDDAQFAFQNSQLEKKSSELELEKVEESILQFVTPGSEIPLTINAFNREMTGSISRIDPVADARTKNVFIEVSIPAFDDMVANMSATVYIPTSAKLELSIIPRDALIKFQGKDFVYTIKEGKASILPVNIVTFLGKKVGADNPYFVPGMVVVIEGNERLRPDQPVLVEGAN
jgi:multidrug efflux pump subunit AcrA (membrane-fusion protein)